MFNVAAGTVSAPKLFTYLVIGGLLSACSPFQSHETPPAIPTPVTSEPPPAVSVPSPPPTPPKPATARRLPPEQLRTNKQCITLLKRAEGLRLQAYRGPSGAWLIGYGHMASAKPGMTITASQAELILREDLLAFERNVSRLLKVEVSNNEFSAMVCLSYNIGWGNFGRSTVLKKVNAGQWTEAADAFLLWDKINGKASTHLQSRRRAERSLFLKLD